MQVDFESIQPVTAEHFKGGEGSVTTQAYHEGNRAPSFLHRLASACWQL